MKKNNRQTKKLYHDVPFEIKAEDVADDGVFSGYGSTFGGKPDSYGDVIAPGAFTETIAKGGRNGTGIAMLWQHKSDEPIGVWRSIEQNKKGLKLEGQLAIKSTKGSDAHELMKIGAIKGLSIGFDIAKDGFTINETTNIRTLKKLNLWEVSPVTFPANTRAQISTVKAIEEATTERELEAVLRDEGLSRRSAMALISKCKHFALPRESAMSNLLQCMKNTNQLLEVNNSL